MEKLRERGGESGAVVWTMSGVSSVSTELGAWGFWLSKKEYR